MTQEKDGAFTWLVVHGAWSAGWAWKKMRSRLNGPGAVLWTPTLTGLGERAHLAGPHVTLETHVQDILAVIEMEGLSAITLVAHSYGGLVGTCVADRARAKVVRLIYLDAFVPGEGQSLADMMGQAPAPPADGMIPATPIPADTSPEDAAWIAPRRTAQPANTFTTPAKFSEANLPPRAYVRCTRAQPRDPLKPSAEKARAAGWPYRELDSSHNPHITMPDMLAETLRELAALL